MKKVQALVRLSALGAVQAALDRRGIEHFTVSEVDGYGREPAGRGAYRGATHRIDRSPRACLEVVVSDIDAGPIAETVARAARTGRPGDGLIAILDVQEAVCIRTGARGARAIAEPDDTGNPPRPAPVSVRAHGPLTPPVERPFAERSPMVAVQALVSMAVVVLVFHGPVVPAAVGGVGGAAILWALGRGRGSQPRR